jgi:chromosome segregation ATPase
MGDSYKLSPVKVGKHDKVSSSMGGDEKISVSIRMRPLNGREKSDPDAFEAIRSEESTNSITEYSKLGLPNPKTTLDFDNVFNTDSSTEDIFDKVARSVVDSCMEGINGTIFAYGQTSSGKTFTMNGDEDGNFPGLLPLSALHIFDTIEKSVHKEYLLRVSFVEIYNEIVTDLFNPQKGPVKIRESREKGVYVEAEEKIIGTFDDLIGMFTLGNKNRHVASTNMNDRSSRSHTIFRITVESKESRMLEDRRLSEESVDSLHDLDGAVLVGALSLVDLAGSENVRNTGASGKTLREGGNINKSLLTLSGVIKTLATAKNKEVHVRFRDSKLTRILQPSLVGNCKTAVICCVTPAAAHLDETRSTLRFASSAKTLITKTSVNEVLDDASMIKRLKKQLHFLRKQQNLDGGTGSEQYAVLQEAKNRQEFALRQAEEVALESKRQAEESEMKMKRLKELTAHIICGSNPGATSSTSSTMRLEKSVSGKDKRMSRRKKRETWCPGEMDLPSSIATGLLSGIAENDGSDSDEENEESRVVEGLSLLQPISSFQSRRATRNPRRASLGSSAKGFNTKSSRRKSHGFAKSTIAKKDSKINGLESQLLETVEEKKLATEAIEKLKEAHMIKAEQLMNEIKNEKEHSAYLDLQLKATKKRAEVAELALAAREEALREANEVIGKQVAEAETLKDLQTKKKLEHENMVFQLNNRIVNLENHVHSITRKETEELKTHTDSLQTKLNAIESMRENLARTRKESSTRISEGQIRIEENEQKLQALSDELKNTKKELLSAREQQHEMEDSFVELQTTKNETIKALKTSLAAYEVVIPTSDFSVQVEDKSEEEKALMLEQQVDALQNQLKTTHDELSSTCEQLKSMKQEQTQGRTIHSESLAAAAKQIKDFEETLKTLRTEKESLSSELKAIKDKHESKPGVEEASTQTEAVTEDEVHDHKEKLKVLEGKHELLEQMNDKLHRQVERLHADLNAANNSSNTSSMATDRLQEQLTKCRKENTDLSFKCESMTTAICKLEHKIKALKLEIEESNDCAADLRSKLDSAQAQSSFNVTSRSLKEQMEKALNEVGPLGFEKLRLEKALRKSEDKVLCLERQLRQQADKQLMALQAEGEKESHTATHCGVKELQQKLTKATEEIQMQKERIVKLEKVKMTRAHVENIKKIKKDSAKLEAANKKLSAQVSTLEQELKQCKAEAVRKTAHAHNHTDLSMNMSLVDEHVRKTMSDNEKLKAKLRKYYNSVQETKNEHQRILNLPCFEGPEFEGVSMETAVMKIVDRLESALGMVVELNHATAKVESKNDDFYKLKGKFEQLKIAHEEIKEQCLAKSAILEKMEAKLLKNEQQNDGIVETMDKENNVNANIRSTTFQNEFKTKTKMSRASLASLDDGGNASHFEKEQRNVLSVENSFTVSNMTEVLAEVTGLDGVTMEVGDEENPECSQQ